MTRTKWTAELDKHPDPAAKLTEKSELAPALTSATPIPQPRYPASIPDPTPFPPVGPADSSKGGTGIMYPKSQGRGGTASPYNLAPAPFDLNQNHVVCLPLVSEHLKLLWASSDQTQELDGVAYLIEAFNVFPYPTLGEMASLAQSCSLHLDQVRVWFMVQRLRYGISWDAEEICMARCKICGPNQAKDKKEKEEKVLPPLSKEGDGRNRSEHSPVSTSNQLSSLSFESSSPVPRKRRKRHPVVAPNNSNLQHPSPPVPLCLVAPPTTTGQTLEAPDNAHETVKPQRHCQDFHSELWRSFGCNTNPPKEELQRLQALTRLHMKYIRKWFCNRRFLLHHRVKADPESEENGQSQPNDLLSSQTQLIQRLTQPPPPTDSRVRPSPTRKRVCQVDDVDFLSRSRNGNHVHGNPANTTHQIRSNVKGKEKEPAEVQKKKTGTADKEETARAGVKRWEKNIKAELKEERNAVGITKFIDDDGKEQVIKMGPWPKNKTIAQLELLRHFFLTCQWPNKGDYTQLQQQTCLSRKALTQWFGDTRYYVKKGMERWMSGEEHRKVLAQIREKQRQRQRDWLMTEETGPSGSSSVPSLRTVTHSANGEAGSEEDGAGTLRPMNGVKLE
ncbi:homeobox and leucine zipper protein Homez-like [Salvelinus fontinalis]|uniref:homeobox and leucine zipper protein Homez-like n=1 Tax=Salvelinus fontinalis TaxID=8038 RepID=UPI0024852A86|nr:homeobox and leucine zipper protein Homez-like [Salvelinus fontinalis]XP_055794312.1 homeobox and leucine zipper protein Homez-like [Salvelinus fontinalis]